MSYCGFARLCITGVLFGASWADARASQPQTPSPEIQIVVRSDSRPIPRAQVVVAGITTETDAEGRATLHVAPGPVQITVVNEGFNPVTVSAIAGTRPAAGDYDCARATDRDRGTRHGLGDAGPASASRISRCASKSSTPKRSKRNSSMTPGDIVMMLNEMGGLRVQATSPSLGAASVRVQGMRGRYTRFLSDGLPLFGADVGGLGLLQIPPTDLGQVEVIKGVASALYGAGALGGVVNLISRRPAKEATREVAREPDQPRRHRYHALRGAAVQRTLERHASRRRTLAATARHRRRRLGRSRGYSRALVRPRVFWNDGTGRSLFATAGAMWEQRNGGTMPSAVLTPTGAPYPESLDTTRLDAGVVAQMPVAGRYVVTARMSATGKDEDYLRGDVREHDVQDTFFAELAVRGSAPRQTWVGGVAFERSTLDPRDEPRFAYRYNVPGSLPPGRHRGTTLADAVGQRTSRCPQRVRHVREPARVSARAGWRLDQSHLDRQRVLCADGADRGNRGCRTRAPHGRWAAQSGAWTQRVVRRHARSGTVECDGHAVPIRRSRSCGRSIAPPTRWRRSASRRSTPDSRPSQRSAARRSVSPAPIRTCTRVRASATAGRTYR